MRPCKEVILSLVRGKYKIRQEDEEEMLKESIDIEKFNEEIEALYKNADFRRFRRRQKFLRFIHFLQLLIITGFFTLLIMSFFMITDEDYSFAETLFNAFCITLITLFFTIIFTIFWELTILEKTRQAVLKYFTNAIQDRFLDTTFFIACDKYLSLRIRPIKPSDFGKKIAESDMDYYEFINYNNPEDEDYYSKENPYKLDPFERNANEEWLSEREKEKTRLKKEKRKKNLLKLGK